MQLRKPYFFASGRSMIACAHDAFMAAASFIISVHLRLGSDQIHVAEDYLNYGTVLFVAVCLMMFISMRLYRGLWRYASMRDLVNIVKAVSLSIIIFSVAMFLINRLEGMPRSVLFINWMLLLVMLGGPRFFYRAIKDRSLSWRMSLADESRIPVLLIGATDNAERFIRDMERDSQAPYQVIAIYDNNHKRKGRSIHHVSIYGDTLEDCLTRLQLKGVRPQKIILTDSATSGEQIREFLATADAFSIPLARLPKSGEVRSGAGEKTDAQPIAVEDLLGRPQNVLDREGMRALIENNSVLITGAGGTIGGELARQISVFAPKLLILLDNGEFNLYRIEQEIRSLFPALSIHAILADVRDSTHITHVFAMYRPSRVFHAAAIKHVPLSEANPEEAVLTNVFGTINIADACLTHGVETMVMISTDKAVNPTNVMGASKRLAETVCQAMAQDRRGLTRYVTVRFGNVLGSTGSVVPLFQEQLAKGGPLTVTHPDITRYFMTVREAVELVLQAAAMDGQEGNRRQSVFVLDMGSPVRILDLARQMIRLAGLRPEQDIAITFTGLRPGEKLYEELFYDAEQAKKTSHQSIYLASPAVADDKVLQTGLHRLLDACKQRNTLETVKMLATLVPEYTPDQITSPYRVVTSKTETAA